MTTQQVTECAICKELKHENQDYCARCLEAPILLQTFEARHGKKQKKKGIFG